MTKQIDLRRIREDLQEAQAEIETARTVEGSLGSGLKFGFNALFAAVSALFVSSGNHESRISEHDRQLKILVAQVVELQKQIHGLKVSRGKAVAAKQKALTAVNNAKDILHRATLH